VAKTCYVLRITLVPFVPCFAALCDVLSFCVIEGRKRVGGRVDVVCVAVRRSGGVDA
jgi:hypothetical protein